MMRSVGQVLLALALVAVPFAGGVFATAHTDPGASGTPSRWSATPDGATAVQVPFGPRPAAGLGGAVGSPAAGRAGASPHLAASRTVGVERERERAVGGASVGTIQPRSDVYLTQEFRLTPDIPGRVRVTHNYSLADRIASLQTTVPRRGTVTEVDGFVAENETIYQWDGATPTPSITYSLPVNETGSRSHAAANGSLLFADVGEWALIRRPATSTSWTAFGRTPVSYERATETVGPGAAGDSLVYLGEVTLYPRTAANQTFRLAVPAAANMTASPDDVLDAMARASADLDVGDRDSAVFAVAAPTDGVPWAARGLSVGDADFWVEADEPLATTDNIWIHEYVHTRQAYEPTATTRWTTEGFATYYAARQALKYEPVTFDAFADGLSNATGNATLADPATWTNRTAYERGALVAGQLDRQLRLGSDGNASIDSVLAAMNADDGEVNASEFFGALEGAGNGSVGRAMRTAVSTDRPVSMWNRSQHVAAYGGLPARFVYGLPRGTEAGAYEVRGPYRNASLSGNGSFRVVTGETFVVDAQASNVGNSTGYFDVELRVDGSVVDTADGRVPAAGRRDVRLSHTFASPGIHTVAVGNDSATVRVRRPANASIVGFQVTPGSIQQYGSATVSVAVVNEAPIPARRTVRLRRGNATVATRTVTLGPASSTEVDVRMQFPTAGATPVGVATVGDVTVAVERVAQPNRPAENRSTPEPTPTSPVSGTGSGFGSLTLLLALLAVVIVARHAR